MIAQGGVAHHRVDILRRPPAEPFDRRIVAARLQNIVAHRAVADDLERGNLPAELFPRGKQRRDPFFVPRAARQRWRICHPPTPGSGSTKRGLTTIFSAIPASRNFVERTLTATYSPRRRTCPGDGDTPAVGRRGRRPETAAITLVLDRRQFERAGQAFFAIMSVARQQRARTEHPKIVQRSHDRRPRKHKPHKRRGRSAGRCCENERHRCSELHQSPISVMHLAVPDGLSRHADRSICSIWRLCCTAAQRARPWLSSKKLVKKTWSSLPDCW